MLRSKRGQCLLAIAAGLSAAGAPAWAVDVSDVLVYRIGSVHLKPRLAVTEQYDDNIFLRPSKPVAGFPFLPVESDFLTVVSPGMNLQLGREAANHFTLDYTMDESFYVNQTSQNHRDHSIFLDTHLAGSRIKLDGKDRLQFLSGVLGGTLNLGQRVDRKVFAEDYRLEYPFTDKVGIYGAAAFQATDYKQGTSLYDDNTIRGTGGFGFRIAPKVTLLGEVYYAQAATSPNVGTLPDGPHADLYGGYAGASGGFTSRLTGSVRVGYEALGFANGAPGSSSPVVEVSLTQRFGERTVASLSYSRRNSISVQVGSSAFKRDAVSVLLSQVITTDGKLQAVATGSLESGQYENTGASASRHDLLYRAGFSLNYNLQLWLRVGLLYDYEKVDSNSNLVFDYVDNRISLRVSVGY